MAQPGALQRPRWPMVLPSAGEWGGGSRRWAHTRQHTLFEALTRIPGKAERGRQGWAAPSPWPHQALRHAVAATAADRFSRLNPANRGPSQLCMSAGEWRDVTPTLTPSRVLVMPWAAAGNWRCRCAHPSPRFNTVSFLPLPLVASPSVRLLRR